MIIQLQRPATLHAFKLSFSVLGDPLPRVGWAFAKDEDDAKAQIRKRVAVRGSRVSAWLEITNR